MTVRLYSVLLLLAVPCIAHAQPPRTPVLVELFTSEGCSSCPPADALLARLDRDQPVPSAEVIVLSEHVDYWDSLGWRDRFSSHQYTERQSAYSDHFHLPDIYTPQMVVAGRAQFIGSDAGAAARAIVQAGRTPGLPLVLTDAQLDKDRISATLTLSTPPAEPAELYAALVTPSESTQVRSGENGGHTLHHAGVVRSLTHIGNTRDLAHAPLQLHLEAPAATQPLRLVVFAQSTKVGPILGVATLSVPASRNTLALAGK